MNQAPGLARRMAAFIYEGVLLFGVVMIAGFLYSVITQHRHALEGRVGLMLFLFAVLGVYFSWFWARGGQTVAMKAWHIRLVTADGAPVSGARAMARYLLSWLWFLPATAAVYAAGLHGKGEVTTAVIAGVLAYAALVWLRRDRQFWHDVVCGTQLIDCKPALPAKDKSGP
ncbi:MAG: RDD family protein [Aquabacterium sp.]|nr:RDD family protein [Aquabacterium sp.]